MLTRAVHFKQCEHYSESSLRFSTLLRVILLFGKEAKKKKSEYNQNPFVSRFIITTQSWLCLCPHGDQSTVRTVRGQRKGQW